MAVNVRIIGQLNYRVYTVLHGFVPPYFCTYELVKSYLFIVNILLASLCVLVYCVLSTVLLQYIVYFI